ncbi:hypothetical protein FGB62_197g01 [Gracilaria domingensis]|nr:hypothetical protein FGB62_197g05 [Gracilaria domingensis]KAI0558638.1 hypothetical protein FGB62_197g01 [Gracilaria domingensis]
MKATGAQRGAKLTRVNVLERVKRGYDTNARACHTSAGAFDPLLRLALRSVAFALLFCRDLPRKAGNKKTATQKIVIHP